MLCFAHYFRLFMYLDSKNHLYLALKYQKLNCEDWSINIGDYQTFIKLFKRYSSMFKAIGNMHTVEAFSRSLKRFT